MDCRMSLSALMGRARGTTPPPPTDYIAAITLLSEADEQTPHTVLVPGSSNHAADTIDELRGRMGEAYQEVVVQQPPGTTLIYDVATYHTRRDPPNSRGRRTQHSYFSRHPAPPRNAWVVVPRRLAEHPDPVVRRFYSNWNGVMRGWQRCGYDSGFLSDNATTLLMSYLAA